MINPIIEKNTLSLSVAEVSSELLALKSYQQHDFGALDGKISQSASWNGPVPVHPGYTKWRVIFFPSTGTGVFEKPISSNSGTDSSVGTFAQIGFDFSVSPKYSDNYGFSDPDGIYDELFFAKRPEYATKDFSTWIISLNGEFSYTSVNISARVFSPVSGQLTISRIV